MNHSPPGSSLCGIFQARILEWVAISSSRGSSQPRDQTQVSCISGRFFRHTFTWDLGTEYILDVSIWCSGSRCPIIVTRLVFHSLVRPFMFVIKPTKLLSDAMSQDMLQLIFIDENVQDKKAQRKTVFWTPCLYVFLIPFYYVTRFVLGL